MMHMVHVTMYMSEVSVIRDKCAVKSTRAMWLTKTLCILLYWKLRETAKLIYWHIHNCTPWHLNVATFSPQTFPFTDWQASVSTSGCFLRPVFLWKDTEGLSHTGENYVFSRIPRVFVPHCWTLSLSYTMEVIIFFLCASTEMFHRMT